MMKQQNILEFHDEESIRTYNFTLTAMKKFYDMIDTSQFRNANGETIYEYLTKMMELVSFREQLKRYLYEKTDQKISYAETDYVELILDSFEKNDCFCGKTRQEVKRQAKRWLNAETVKRETMFLIGFGLDMTDETITKFLTLVLKEQDFDFYNPQEVIYWHCRHTGKSYAEAQNMADAYRKMKLEKPAREDHLWSSMQSHPKLYLGMEESLEKYLHYLKSFGMEEQKVSRSREVFQRLYERVQKDAAWMKNRYPDENSKRVLASEITPGTLESMLYSGVPVTEKGNLRSFAALKKQFQGKRFNRARIHEVLAGKPVERFDLITLSFFAYALEEEKLELQEGPRFCAFVEETNALLSEAGMLDLYPVNPYEAFILMCIVSEDPADAFETVWEKSYDE